MAPDASKHVSRFLDPEEKFAMSQLNRGSHNALQTDNDVHCYRATNNYASCSGSFVGLRVGPECLQFCKNHVNEVIAKLVNIMFSGHIVAHLRSGQLVTVANPHAYVEHDNPEGEDDGQPYEMLFYFDESNFQEPNFGDWVVSQFDFRRRDWQRITFDFLDLEELNYEDVNYDFQGNDYQLNVIDDQLIVHNEMFGIEDPAPEPVLQVAEVQEACNLRDCTSAIRGSVLDFRCIVFCREKMNLAMADILKLLTSSRIFVQDQNGFSYQLSEDWKIKVIGVDGSLLLMMESRYDLGEDALQHSDFTSPDWLEVQVIFEKENTHHAPSVRESRIVTMWAQQDDKSVFLKTFHESRSEVRVVIPNPQHMNMDNPE
jgi:hypothetical protein